jgi:hypothetical protein
LREGGHQGHVDFGLVRDLERDLEVLVRPAQPVPPPLGERPVRPAAVRERGAQLGRLHAERAHEPLRLHVGPGYRVAMAPPQGPVYIALDAGLQEDEVDEDVALPDFARLRVPAPMGPDPRALRALAERLVAARRPVIVAGYAGRDPRAFDQIVELSELLAIGLIDTR